MIPTYKTTLAAGADIFCAEDIEIAPHSIALIKTGYFLPDGIDLNYPSCYIEVSPRSSLPIKKGLIDTLGGGKLDLDYRKEVFLQVYNTKDTPVLVEKGEAVGQLVLKEYIKCRHWRQNHEIRGESGSTGGYKTP